VVESLRVGSVSMKVQVVPAVVTVSVTVATPVTVDAGSAKKLVGDVVNDGQLVVDEHCAR
jgi:hypothetical protein